MRRIAPIFALAVLAACADTGSEPLAPSERGDIAPLFTAVGSDAAYGSYIVVLNEDANPRSVAAVMGIQPSHVYEHTIRGFWRR